MFDIIIHNGIVVTVDNPFSILADGAVAVRRGRVERVWSPTAGETLPSAKEVVDAKGGIVMPGLVNTHSHLPMSLFRGLADDLPLDRWLQEHIFPAEAQHITSDSVCLGARLSAAEMLLSGTTTCCDGYFLANDIAKTVDSIGLRAVLGQGVIDFPAPGVPDPARNVIMAKAYVQEWQGRSSILYPSIFCHSPYTCSAQTLKAAKQAADESGALLQIHVAETRAEVQQCRSENGCSPIQYLKSLGILDERTLLVHAIWLDDADIATVVQSGAPIAHCPESNMKLGSGIAPVPDFLDAGITVGLGTDGCASNNDLDMLGEMDTVGKLHKVHRLDPTVMDAVSVVRMATIAGARALGLDNEIGSLEKGKQADLIIIDLAQPHLMPLYHPASHLVSAVGRADVRQVMVAGRWLVRDGRLLTIDLDSLLQQAAEIGRTIGSGMSGISDPMMLT